MAPDDEPHRGGPAALARGQHRRRHGHRVLAGRVAVRNGSGIDGAGLEAQALVESLGYDTTVANANNSDYKETVVVYSEAGQRPYAEEIVEKLGCGRAEQDDGDYIFTGNFLVLIGSDWARG